MDSQYFHNWCKLQLLLATKASEFLKTLFKKLWQARFNKPWDNSSGQELVNIIKPQSFKKYFKSQRDLLKNGDMNNWDLQLLRNVFIDSDICGADKQGDDYRKNSEKLAEFRNKFEHHSSKNISDADFEVNWEKISKILVTMGESKDELDELKVSLRLNKMVILRIENITKANEMKLKGNEYFKEKKYTEAISSYTDAIDLKEIPNQDLAVLYSNRSMSYLKRKNNEGDIKNALKDAKECKKLRPEWSKAHFRLGIAYVELNKLEKAIKALEESLILEPNNEEVKNALTDARKTRAQQESHAHVDPGREGVTQEQIAQEFFMRTGKKLDPKDSDFFREFSENQYPALKDVWEGHDYRDGTNGVEIDLTKAVQCYWRAVKKGNAEAMYNLALLTQEGEGVNQNYALAFSLYQKAAEQPPFDPFTKRTTVGVAEAQHCIGVYYQNGIHVDKNYFTAIYWFERGVENGFGRSANDLGLMYLHGFGVPQDLKRAEQYLLFALSHEDHNAPGNLACLYGAIGDPEKALKWNKVAIEKGSLNALVKQEELETLYAYSQARLQENGVEKWEKANKLSPENLTPEERIKRKLEFKFGDKGSALIQNFQRMMIGIMTPPKALTPSSGTCKFDFEELEKYRQTSKTASRMHEAMWNYLKALDCLLDIDISKDTPDLQEMESRDDFICYLAECFRLEQIVASLSIEVSEIAQNIAKYFFSSIHSLRQKEELNESLLEFDQDARFCFASLNMGTPDIVISFLSECINMYPNNKDFLLVRGEAYGFKYQYENALRDANRGLEIEPDNYDFLYLKAVSFRVLGHSNAVKAYERFVSKAPVDHRKIPEAYYAMGVCILCSKEVGKQVKNNNFKKGRLKEVKEYYERGLEMEKKQLPFFLPYQSPCKRVLEPWMNPEKLLEKVQPPSSIDKIKLKDPSRKELILLNRKNINNLTDIPTDEDWMSTTFKPPKEQKLPQSLIGLKQTYLNEIDFTKDHILTGRVLEVTVIDVAHRNERSIQLVIEDKNEHVQRVALYNFDESEIDVQELGVGSKFSIINPYIRMAIDLKPIIRVEDSSSVIFSEKCANMCACCGDLSVKVACKDCKRNLYCSEECQLMDFHEFKHYLICVKHC